MLTQKQLKEVLHYCPDSGVFTWKVSKHNRVKLGAIAGSIDAHGYRVIRVSLEIYKSHRLAFLYQNGNLPKNQVDHINGNKSDNRIKNLRQVSNKENAKNQKLRVTNTSGVVGVSFHSIYKKWQASICCNYKYVYLGRFKDFFEAVCARKSAEVRFGFHENHGRR